MEITRIGRGPFVAACMLTAILQFAPPPATPASSGCGDRELPPHLPLVNRPGQA
jgi:hypothetical protein